MRRSFLAPALLPLIAVMLSVSAPGRADDGRNTASVTIAVVDFDYLDTSGEERDQSREHAARLKDFMAALRSDLAAHGKTVVSLKCGLAPCSPDRPAELLRAAREAGAGIVLLGSIHKMSTLIQWAKAEAIDAATDRVLLDKLFTFRGDNDDSWRRAEAFIAGEMASLGQTGGR
jgi:hypothetical protein